MFVLALPIEAKRRWLSVMVFIGGLSAATAMVIVECVALAVMVSNDLVMPLVLKRGAAPQASERNFGGFLLTVRRIAIFAILLMAYLYFRELGNTQLAAIGLLSFAAIAQFAPSFFGGLVWRRATALGAIGGMVIGFVTWAYTLFLPSFLESNTAGHAAAAARPVRHRGAAPAGAVRRRSAAAAAWRAVEPVAQPAGLYRAVAAAPAVVDRAAAGRGVRAGTARRPIDAAVPALAHHRDGAGYSRRGGAISRPGAGARKRSAPSPPIAASTSNRRRRPISNCCSTPSI